MSPFRKRVQRLAAGLGYHVVRKDYYDIVERHFTSPVPDLGGLADRAFDRVSPLRGVHLDADAHIAFAERELARYVPEFDAPDDAAGDTDGFHLWNDYLEAGDAEIAYAMVRNLKPKRVVELGSGYSTLVLARACVRNEEDGAAALLKSFDPFPPELLEGRSVQGLAEYRPLPTQRVPEEEFEALAAGDLLFVDTSHTVKLGGDVNAIVLDVLPLLAPGVVVHFHDIWLPYEYHRTLVEEMRLYWAEQYLLQAFLAFNERFEVVFAAQAVARRHPERLRRLVPSYEGRNFPTSFWIRRVA